MSINQIYLRTVLLSQSIDDVNDATSSVANTASEASTMIQDSVNKVGISRINPVLVKIISILLVILMGVVVCKIIHHLLKKYIIESDSDKITGSHVTYANILYNIIKFVIGIFSITVIMDIVGINVTGIVAGLGVVGAIAGLAAQDLLKDFIAGTNIASQRYFAIGDTIECQGYIGQVTDLSMRSTKLTTIDGSVVTIQNHLIDRARLISRENSVKLQLPYELNRPRAYELAELITEEVKKIDGVSDASSCGISSFEDSAILYMIKFYCDPMASPRITRLVNDISIRILDEAGVEIPYMQIDIHQK